MDRGEACAKILSGSATDFLCHFLLEIRAQRSRNFFRRSREVDIAFGNNISTDIALNTVRRRVEETAGSKRHLLTRYVQFALL
jgi:hypothetical protein